MFKQFVSIGILLFGSWAANAAGGQRRKFTPNASTGHPWDIVKGKGLAGARDARNQRVQTGTMVQDRRHAGLHWEAWSLADEPTDRHPAVMVLEHKSGPQGWRQRHFVFDQSGKLIRIDVSAATYNGPGEASTVRPFRTYSGSSLAGYLRKLTAAEKPRKRAAAAPSQKP
jgi:hypothetical protein